MWSCVCVGVGCGISVEDCGAMRCGILLEYMMCLLGLELRYSDERVCVLHH